MFKYVALIIALILFLMFVDVESGIKKLDRNLRHIENVMEG